MRRAVELAGEPASQGSGVGGLWLGLELPHAAAVALFVVGVEASTPPTHGSFLPLPLDVHRVYDGLAERGAETGQASAVHPPVDENESHGASGGLLRTERPRGRGELVEHTP